MSLDAEKLYQATRGHELKPVVGEQYDPGIAFIKLQRYLTLIGCTVNTSILDLTFMKLKERLCHLKNHVSCKFVSESM